ncbi:MAG: hypothetical protein K9H48_18350 [Melioribacteraceae bacterium]|nr:hypothetical protein [Melioribacteraceae bacterium]MCF8396401.1 hypothetical protein [Melioribacteraceae bacterium]
MRPFLYRPDTIEPVILNAAKRSEESLEGLSTEARINQNFIHTFQRRWTFRFFVPPKTVGTQNDTIELVILNGTQ